MSFNTLDYHCMGRAVQLAKRGLYTADPNPRVGCVIAANGKIVGEGFHRRAGEPHAEINALDSAGARARDAVVYVTLEPCNHQGRTGPCAQALIRAGVAEVVFGMKDPHNLAAGGIQTLRSAGIRVRGPLLEEQCRALNQGFVKRCETGLPFVTMKLAMSLDGRTAMASGESQWITGESARRDVQCLRARSSAIVTGIGTVLEDDPALTVRANMLPLDGASEIASRQPLRVVVDSRSRTPSGAKLFQTGGKVLVATASDQPGSVPVHSPQVSQVALPDGFGGVNLKALLELLAQIGCNEILVEAGPVLSGAFLRAKLVDKLVIYMAGKLMGSNARPLMDLPFDTMGESVALNIQEIRCVGKDWRITAVPEGI